MPHFATTIDIHSAPTSVVAVLMDVEHWAEWTSTITSIQKIDSGPFLVGSRARVRQPKLMPAVWQVTELDPERGFTWVTRSPGLKIAGLHYVEPLGSSASRVTLSLDFSGFIGSLAARFYRNLNKRYLAMEAEGLKRRVEAGLIS